jgi:enoyl-CoA hydratase/carnithine racemase
MTTFEDILYAVEGQVATVTLHRPEQLNAWTAVMETEVRAALAQANEDPAVHAIVITGAGRGFCAGADLKAGGARARAVDGAGDFDQRYTYLLGLDKPVIAAINGPVAGVGLCLTLYCDFRFMAEGQKVTTAFARRGLIAEHGSAWMLPRIVGLANALQLLMEGATVTTEEAARIGLVTPLPQAGFLEQVQAFARDLVTKSSPRSLRVIKQQVYDGLRQSLGEAVIASNELQRQSLECEDLKEGVTAFREGRAPQFTGR